MKTGTVETTTTIFPDSQIEPKARVIDDDMAVRLGSTLYIIIESALSDREILDETLDYWYSLLEMYSPPRNVPWPNASNVVIPVVPAHYDALSSQISQQVFRQRLFLVTPNTQQAAPTAHATEWFFNQKSQKLDLVETLNQWKDMALRDGVSFLEVLYKHTKRKEQIVVWEDELDANGQPKINLRTRKPQRTPKTYTIDVDDYNDVYFEPIELRDFVIYPSWQLSIDEAHGVARKLYLDENTLRAMVNDGYLDAKQVEIALNFVTSGSSERTLDEQGWQTVTAGGKVIVGAEEGVTEKSLGQMRGPIMVWRIHTNSFTLLEQFLPGNETVAQSHNPVPAEYVIWLHHQSQRVLGYKRYEYGHGKRPFVPYAPIPRPRRLYGWSIIGRLAPIASETFNLWNGRNDMIDIITRPSMYRRVGAKIVEPQGAAFGPGVWWEVSQPDDIGIIGGGRLNIDFSPSIQQEQMLLQWAGMLTGANPNMQGSVNPGGRKTAREVNSANMGASIRVGFMANRFRRAIEKAFWMWRQLQIQYGPDEMVVSGNMLGVPQQMTVTREMLAQDYALSVAGADGQLDQEQRANMALQTFLLLKDDPDIAQDPVKRYRLKAYLLEAQNNPNILSLIGTEDEAVQNAQKQQQFHQAVMQLAQQGVQVPGMPPPQQVLNPQQQQHAMPHKPPVKPGQLVSG